MYYFITKTRNRQVGKGIHAACKSNCHFMQYEEISNLFYEKSKAPHCVFELIERDRSRIIKNSIHLSGMTINKYDGHSHNVVSYKKIELGEYFRSKNRSKKSGSKSQISLNLGKMAGQYVVVTANKAEVVENAPNFIVLSSVSNSNKKETKSNASGVVVLMMTALSRKAENKSSMWKDSDNAQLRSAKKNILSSGKGKHFGSLGEYYSFGNKEFYGKRG